jgi:hypothetical protein
MSRQYKLEMDIAVDGQFWAIIPAVNINFHSGITIEFEWLCFGLYFRRVDNKVRKTIPPLFYCELDGNFAHRKCEEQCKHCKREENEQ